MADRIRFHLDEHVAPSAARESTQQRQARSVSERKLTRLIYSSLALRDADSDHCGIVFYAANQSMREIIEGLILIYEVMTANEMTGNIEYL